LPPLSRGGRSGIGCRGSIGTRCNLAPAEKLSIANCAVGNCLLNLGASPHGVAPFRASPIGSVLTHGSLRSPPPGSLRGGDTKRRQLPAPVTAKFIWTKNRPTRRYAPPNKFGGTGPPRSVKRGGRRNGVSTTRYCVKFQAKPGIFLLLPYQGSQASCSGYLA